MATKRDFEDAYAGLALVILQQAKIDYTTRRGAIHRMWGAFTKEYDLGSPLFINSSTSEEVSQWVGNWVAANVTQEAKAVVTNMPLRAKLKYRVGKMGKLSNKVAIILLIITVAPLLLMGCGNPEATPTISVPVVESDLAQRNAELEKELYESQLNYAQASAAYNSALQAYNSTLAQIGVSPVTVYPTYPDRLQELIATQIALQEWADRYTDIEKLYLKTRQSEFDVTEKLEYLLGAIERVNNKTDKTTTSNLTAEKREHFYEMWSLWYDTVDRIVLPP